MLACGYVACKFLFLIGIDPKGFVDVPKGGKQFGFSIYQRNIVFEVSTGLPIGSKDCPAIPQLLYTPGSHVDHWLNGNDHSVLELLAPSAFAVIGHFRGFMKFSS